MSNLPVSQHPERALLVLWLHFWVSPGSLALPVPRLHSPLAHMGQDPSRAKPARWQVLGPGEMSES